MWSKVLGLACAGVFVGAFLVEMTRSKKDRAAEQQSAERKPSRDRAPASV